jgi:hypothetical protein
MLVMVTTHAGLAGVGPKNPFGPRGLLCNAKGLIVWVLCTWARLGIWRIVTTWVTLLEKKASSC